MGHFYASINIFFFFFFKLNVLLCNTLRRGAAVAQQIEQVY